MSIVRSRYRWKDNTKIYHIERRQVIVDQIHGLRIRLSGSLCVKGSEVLGFV